MTALGIGVRVWIGWCADDELGGDIRVDGRLQRGTIVAGPFRSGDRVICAYTGKRVYFEPGRTNWNVALDRGGQIGADESLLTPIDDGDAGVEVSDAREVTA